MTAAPDLQITWEPAPDVAVVALRTPTLPPATATNTTLLGRAPWVVDPATPHPDERERLLAVLARSARDGRRPRAIVLTHHHRDHVGAAAWLRDALGLPILAHPRTRELLVGELAIDATIGPGDRLDGWTVHHTPGHASGHIVLHDPARGVLVAGDMVATTGTIIVDPPDGHMASYLASLRALRALAAEVLIPAHGAPIIGATAVHAHLSYYLAHRETRERQVLAALSHSASSLDAITRGAYPELAPSLLPLARRSALAHLDKLVDEGRATAHADGWIIGAHAAPTDAPSDASTSPA